MIKKLYNGIITKLDAYFSKNEQTRINELELLNNSLKSNNRNLQTQLDIRQDTILRQRTTLETLREEIKKYNKSEEEKELEDYWNNKRSKVKITHPARDRIAIDPRIFLGLDSTLYYPTKGSNDEKAQLCLKYVAKRITYVGDKKENWQFAYETWKRRKGDCEDGAILIAVMMLMAGIPYWRIRLNAGNVKGGGHAYITYLRETDNKWYIMDWCYWYDESKDYKKTWDEAKNYFGIWFSCNQKYCYGRKEK